MGFYLPNDPASAALYAEKAEHVTFSQLADGVPGGRIAIAVISNGSFTAFQLLSRSELAYWKRQLKDEVRMVMFVLFDEEDLKGRISEYWSY